MRKRPHPTLHFLRPVTAPPGRRSDGCAPDMPDISSVVPILQSYRYGHSFSSHTRTVMKLFALLAAWLLAALCTAYGQTFHSPAEIRRIMENSPLIYSVTILDSNDQTPADTYVRKLIDHGAYLAPDSTGHRKFGSYKQQLQKDPDAAPLYAATEAHFLAGDMEKAREGYSTLLERYPDNALLLTYLGQTWQKSDDDGKAKDCFLRALELNPHDFMAHWLLAGLYGNENELEKAVEHITTAHLLNRNNPLILLTLKYIYGRNGTPYDDWEFLPRYALTWKSGDEREVAIDSAEAAWMIYAFCQALWEFEPGYSMDMMQNTSGTASTVREMESLLVTAEYARILYTEENCPVFLARLQEASQNGDLELFAVYEIFMRRTPEVGMLMNTTYRDKIRDFIRKYHRR